MQGPETFYKNETVRLRALSVVPTTFFSSVKKCRVHKSGECMATEQDQNDQSARSCYRLSMDG